MQREAYISTAYVGLLFEYLKGRGYDPEALLGAPWPDTSSDPLGRFPMSEWQRLLNRADDVLQMPAMGIEIGRLITPAHIGILGYALLACTNLAQALSRLERYVRLIYDHGPMDTHFKGNSIELEWGESCVQPGQLVDEVAITALVQFARNVTDRHLTPDYVCFLNPEPADVSVYEGYFGCPVAFNQRSTIVRFPIESLELPLRQADPALLSILEPQADTLFIFAGLEAVFGQTGQVLPAGDPLGLMGGELRTDVSLSGDGAGNARPETLYIEVRELNQPVDPQDWFRTTDKG